jgi:DNA-directed RNA polymerase specialized sigma24 family protein
MVSATDKGGAAVVELTPEQRRIVELCTPGALSVAEIAAHLSMPLGVVRVLVADLAEDHLLEVFEGAVDLAADVELLQRLIARVKAIPG